MYVHWRRRADLDAQLERQVKNDIEQQAWALVERHNRNYKAAWREAIDNGADKDKNEQYWHAVADYILAKWSE